MSSLRQMTGGITAVQKRTTMDILRDIIEKIRTKVKDFLEEFKG